MSTFRKRGTAFLRKQIAEHAGRKTLVADVHAARVTKAVGIYEAAVKATGEAQERAEGLFMVAVEAVASCAPDASGAQEAWVAACVDHLNTLHEQRAARFTLFVTRRARELVAEHSCPKGTAKG